METTITEITPVEFDLEIKATAESLAPHIDKALRKYRPQVQMNGFRPGRVPMSLVKKLHGKAVAVEVIDNLVQDTYETEVMKADAYSVLGSPTVTRLEYEPDGDLEAVVRFGVRPPIELVDLSKETISKLIHVVTDEDVQHELENLQDKQAVLVPHEGPVGEKDQVIMDIQRLDPESGTPLIGEKQEDAALFLNDPGLDADVKAALLGKSVDDQVRVMLPDPDADANADAADIERVPFSVTIKDIKRRELPEIDDEFAAETSEGKLETLDELREDIRGELEARWESAARRNLEDRIINRMIALHPVPVPQGAVESFLDAFVDDVRQRNEGNLPDGFDEPSFRDANLQEAEAMVRWMLIKDHFVETENLAVTDADLDAHFDEMAGDKSEVDSAMMRKFFEQMNMMDNLETRIINQKIFDALLDKFEVVEKSRADFEKEQAEEEQEGQEGQEEQEEAQAD